MGKKSKKKDIEMLENQEKLNMMNKMQKLDKLSRDAKRDEVKSYNVDVEFWNTVTEDIDWLNYTVFAKNFTEMEKKVKKSCGEFFIGIHYCEVNGGIPIS